MLKTSHVNNKQPNVQTMCVQIPKATWLTMTYLPISLVKAGEKQSKINLTSLTRSALPFVIPFSILQ